MNHINKEIALGRVNLSGEEGALFKRTLLCRVGTFDGMYGPVEVTAEKIQSLADKYNAIRAKPQNHHDFAPILKDHERKVDYVLGRLVTPLTAEPWLNPATGEEMLGLFGDLRIDDEQAKQKVHSGQFSQVSISFDDDINEIYEVSFVAVEAARRSQVLSKNQNGGPKMDVKLKALKESKNALSKRVEAARVARKSTYASLGQTLKQAEDGVTALQAKAKDAAISLKAAALRSQFNGFIRQGKITPVDAKAIDCKALAALPADALKIVLKSYDDRKPSTDIVQFGKSGVGPKPKDFTEMTPAEVRAAIELQKSGKKPVALADGETPADKTPDEAPPEESVDAETADEAVDKLQEVIDMLGGVIDSVKKADAFKKSMQSDDDKEEADLKKLAEADAKDDEEKPEKKD